MTLLDLAFGGLLMVALTVIGVRQLNRRIRTRMILNKMLAVANDDFFAAANKLMQTPEDLPDEVLANLRFMSRASMERGSEVLFLEALRHGPTGQGDLLKAGTMRKELQDLYAQAMLAWFLMMTSKSSSYYSAINTEVMARLAERHTLMPTPGLAKVTASKMIETSREPEPCAA